MYADQTMPAKGYGVDARSYAEGSPEVAPLTAEIMNRASEALDTAQRVYGRLYSLRSRVFGDPPTAPGENQAKSSPSAFSEAWSDRSRALQWTLNEIDALANELANRL